MRKNIYRVFTVMRISLGLNDVVAKITLYNFLITIMLVALNNCTSFAYTDFGSKPILVGDNGKGKCEVKYSQRIWSAFYGIVTLGDKAFKNISFEENHVYQISETYSTTEIFGTLCFGLISSITVKSLGISDCGKFGESEESKSTNTNEG